MCASINVPSRRRGYTLLELVVTLGTSAILVAGLTSTLFISTKTLTPDATASAESNRSSLVLSQLTGDLRLALGFTERTTKAVTFTVPDRTGDSAVETIRYSWSGTAGDPLVYQFNGGTAINLATNVQQFNLTALTRTIAASSVVTPVYETPCAETSLASAGNSVVIAKPTGLLPGQLMLAAVAVDGDVTTVSSMPSGWTLIGSRTKDSASQVTLAVYRKLATGSEPSTYSFTWTGGTKKAFGWIMRFSGADSATPINNFAFTAGSATSSTPACPTVTTTVANTTVVRIGAFDGGGVTINSPGLSTPSPGHTAITMNRSDTAASAVSGGAGYALQATAGATGTSNFAIGTAQEFVTCTIAIAPEDGL